MFMIITLIVLHCSLQYCFSDDDARLLVYPPGFGNKVQFIVGIGVPASNLPTVQSVTWGYVIKTNYVLPTNVSEYGDSVKYMKRSASISRWDFYQSVVDVINRVGLDGEECMKRSICEAAQVKFSTQFLIGELIHILLLPSSSGDIETDYYNAELVGRHPRTSCARTFRLCPISFVDLFSMIQEEAYFSSLLEM